MSRESIEAIIEELRGDCLYKKEGWRCRVKARQVTPYDCAMCEAYTGNKRGRKPLAPALSPEGRGRKERENHGDKGAAAHGAGLPAAR